MNQIYAPKFLRYEPPKGIDAEDQEVFSMVKNNPARMVDADALPPIVVENDGAIHFQEPFRLPAHVKQAFTFAAFAGAFLLGFILAMAL